MPINRVRHLKALALKLGQVEIVKEYPFTTSLRYSNGKFYVRQFNHLTVHETHHAAFGKLPQARTYFDAILP